jgi:hypothetical protein
LRFVVGLVFVVGAVTGLFSGGVGGLLDDLGVFVEGDLTILLGIVRLRFDGKLETFKQV